MDTVILQNHGDLCKMVKFFLRNSLNIGLFLANLCTEKHTYKALILPSLASNRSSIEVLHAAPHQIK